MKSAILIVAVFAFLACQRGDDDSATKASSSDFRAYGDRFNEMYVSHYINPNRDKPAFFSNHMVYSLNRTDPGASTFEMNPSPEYGGDPDYKCQVVMEGNSDSSSIKLAKHAGVFSVVTIASESLDGEDVAAFPFQFEYFDDKKTDETMSLTQECDNAFMDGFCDESSATDKGSQTDDDQDGKDASAASYASSHHTVQVSSGDFSGVFYLTASGAKKDGDWTKKIRLKDLEESCRLIFVQEKPKYFWQ